MATYIPYFVILFGFILFVMAFLKSKSFFNPLGIILIIWSVLLALSNFSITGLFVPSIHTQGLFVLVMFFCTLGGMCATPSKTRLSTGSEFIKYKILLFLLVVIVAPVVIHLSYNSLRMIINHGFAGFIFLTRYKEGSGRSLIFGDGYLRVIFSYFILSTIYASIFIGVSYIFLQNRKHIFIISIILLSLYTIIMSARIGILVIAITTILSYIYILLNKKKFNKLHLKKLKKVTIVVFLTLIAAIIWLSTQRGRSSFTYIDIFAHYGITYHTLGFTIFDQIVQDEKSYLNANVTYGRATFGFVDQILEVLSRRIDDKGIRSVSRELSVIMDERIFVGNNRYGRMYHNAYYTVLYPLYLDGRILGLMIIPFIYGYFLLKSFLSWKKYNDLYNFTMIGFLFYVGYTSLMMPVVIRQFFWPTFIIIWLFGNFKFPNFVIIPKSRRLLYGAESHNNVK